ncbi:MAG: hypothetical protein EOP09_00765 [Proteobacteria bacterium]|nr:MAG: hypothetical protein EOP09_00765 [Pseudomonadota bacterium]
MTVFRRSAHQYALIAGTAFHLLLWPLTSYSDVKLADEIQFPKPSPSVMDDWKQNFIRDEVWYFANANELVQLLLKPLAAFPEIVSQLKQNMFDVRMPPKQLRTRIDLSRSLYGIPGSDGSTVGVVVDSRLRSAIPVWMKRSMDEYSLARRRLYMWGRFRSGDEIDAFLERAHLSAERLARVKSEVIKVGDVLIIPLTTENWKYFPDEMREQYIQDYLKRMASLTLHHELYLNLNVSNVSEIVEQYAVGTDPKVLRRFLTQRLGGQSEVKIPLRELLPDFIRKNLARYQACAGPNCFNSSLNVARGREAVIQFTTQEDLMKQISMSYRRVRPDEPLRLGDVLVYSSLKDEMKHASTYIDRDYAFTKNGLGRSSPYVFQKHSEIEQGYFKDDRFQLSVFRIPESGQAVLSADGRGWRGAYTEPYFKGRLSRPLGVSAQMSTSERAAVFKQADVLVRKNSLSLEQWVDLLGDPDAREQFETLHKLFKQWSKFADHELELNATGFNPIGEVAENQQKLKTILESEFLTDSRKKFLWRVKKNSNDYDAILTQISIKHSVDFDQLDSSGVPLVSCHRLAMKFGL